ncbi:UDPGT domain-containing protein [Rhizoctonia solani AG-1 IA]|uniref:UDPGT domain-containing protein n=1 Tax=Thanatephorus cucumeris (strain AG1-IA) TaxID=983506 RepID=L8WZX4_THACA|nr:UDPGT domain-containing protein [Rhizoctonia solani AG-1 IA]
MVNVPLKHVVFVPGPPWGMSFRCAILLVTERNVIGHLRPGMKTALRLVEKFPDLFICSYICQPRLFWKLTYLLLALFVYQTELHKAIKYLDAQPQVYTRRIRLVTEPTDGPSVASGQFEEMIASLEVSFGSWIVKETQQATVVQVDGRPVNPPSVIIEDLFTGGVGLARRDEHNLPVVAWWIMLAGSLVRILTTTNFSEEVGALQDSSRHGTLPGEDQVPEDTHDQLVSVPGLPPYYSWESKTQDVPDIDSFFVYLIARWKNMVKHIDTVFCSTTFEMEPLVAAALPGAFGKSLKTYCVGPSVDLVPPHQPDPKSPVTQFLDRAYVENGAHSVIYISFGTVFFPLPSSMPHLMAALDEVAKAGFKFVFALSSKSATLDKSWMDAHIEAGNAVFPEWANQTAVLEHPVRLGTLIADCSKSNRRSSAGNPLLFISRWVELVHRGDCAWRSDDLLADNVRTGAARSTAYRNSSEVEIVGTEEAVRDEMRQILKMSKGTRGKHQRMNIRMLGKVVTDSLGPGGSGDIALEQFGRQIGLA